MVLYSVFYSASARPPPKRRVHAFSSPAYYPRERCGLANNIPQ